MPRGRKYVCMPIVDRTVQEVNEKVVLALHSEKMAEALWNNVVLARPELLRDTLLSAVKRVPKPLAEIDPLDLKTHLAGLGMSPGTKQWVVRSLNEVLRYLGRPILPNPRIPVIKPVTYIPLDTFLLKLPQLHPDYQLYLASLYGTGCRFAELPAGKLQGKYYWVDSQLKLKEKGPTFCPTKNKRNRENMGQRHAPTLPPLFPFITAYVALPAKKQHDLCLNHYKRIYGACTRLYGQNIHTLRHSYAIEWADRGATPTQIASYIGDTEAVCKRHYLKYVKPKKDPW